MVFQFPSKIHRFNRTLLNMKRRSVKLFGLHTQGQGLADLKEINVQRFQGFFHVYYQHHAPTVIVVILVIASD